MHDVIEGKKEKESHSRQKASPNWKNRQVGRQA